MRIFILGVGKSGTTALVYKLAGGLPNCKAFSGGEPGKYLGDYENAVYKHTYEERKGKSFELFADHLRKEHYDKKIWMARDPRDVAVSRMLYRWHKGNVTSRKQYRAHLDVVLKKEQNPGSVPFHVICRYAGHNGWPMTSEQVVEQERIRYKRMHDFVKSLDDDWFLFKFEDMVDSKTGAINDYLGFQVQDEAEVPKSSGKSKVVRKKSYGDWRDWFTEEDAALFKPAYIPYMALIGYDCDDWTPNPNPVIDPQFSSQYMMSLPRKKTFNILRWAKDIMIQRLIKRR
jgi:hypothetical protein